MQVGCNGIQGSAMSLSRTQAAAARWVSPILAIHSDARAAIYHKGHMTYTKVSDAIRFFVTTNTATHACAA
jgi:hypothetical protein